MFVLLLLVFWEFGGFARDAHVDAPLFAAMMRTLERCLRDFSPQALANAAWECARAASADALGPRPWA